MRRKTTKEFITSAIGIHGDKYDYSKVVYIGAKSNITIICSTHGEFEQLPSNHLNGSGCNLCGINQVSNQLKKTNNQFIKDVTIKHDNKYDYSKVKYVNTGTKIKIICPEHGGFEQTPNSHLSGNGCPICATINCSNKLKKTTQTFIKEATEVHNLFYSYDKTDYMNHQSKVIITCPDHGDFEQRANTHLSGHGCPKCVESKGERFVREYLTENNIPFETSHRFPDCKNINTLPFDFYLPEQNICIEYDGKQHYEVIKFFGGVGSLKQTQQRDKIKSQYCLDNGIKLIRIRYDENIIDSLQILKA